MTCREEKSTKEAGDKVRLYSKAGGSEREWGGWRDQLVEQDGDGKQRKRIAAGG